LLSAEDEEPNDVERIALSCLKLENEVEEILPSNDTAADSLSARLEAFKKKRKLNNSVQAVEYVNPAFIAATSVVCEWFFSIAGYTLDQRRKGLLPANLEMQLFLKVNSAFWDAGIFFKAVKEYLQERKITLEELDKEAEDGETADDENE
jgi:predicted site-specific integrase-resolvase